MTGLDLRYTKTQLLLRGEYLFGTLAGDHMRGWYLDAYYRLPQHEHWSLVARIERLKPGEDDPESRQFTLGVRYVATPRMDAGGQLAAQQRPVLCSDLDPHRP